MITPELVEAKLTAGMQVRIAGVYVTLLNDVRIELSRRQYEEIKTWYLNNKQIILPNAKEKK